MARRLRIGLTGGIASGKSTVAQRFAELGIAVIDADDVSRAVVAPGTPGLAAIQTLFGASATNARGELDRRALRDRVFAEPDARRQLESVLHPLIRAEMDRRAASALGPYIVLAIPLLIEGGSADRVDRVLVVDVDEATQMERLIARDHSTEAQAAAILGAQATRAQRLSAADDVIVNAGTVTDLRQAVDNLHTRYLHLAETAPAD